MGSEITIPLWQFVLLAVLAMVVVLKQFLFPSVRWFFRKRINRAINELNQRLNTQINPFQLTKRQILLDRLTNDPQVLTYVQAHSINQRIPYEVLMESVQKYAREIVPSFNAYVYHRIGYWISKKIAQALYRVRVRVKGQQHLKNIDKDATVVYVMNHRSNMDYILVAFLIAEKMTLSYAVGEWAKVWPLQGLVKSMGAYFVRRNSKNPLYRKVLERYIAMATNEGVCQAVFPEGGLTRDGAIRPPKLGFLDYMLRNYNHKLDRDIVFVPVGINYDRVLEDRTLLRLLPPKKPQKSRWFMIKTIYKLWSHHMKLVSQKKWKKFGYASVSFAEPVSAKAYCLANNTDFTKLETEQRFEIVSKFADSLMLDIEKTVPVVPLVLMASVFLNYKDTIISKTQAKEAARALMNRIEAKGANIVFPYKNKAHNLDASIEMLSIRHLIKVEGEFCSVPDESIQLLTYYENSIKYWLKSSTLKA
jgi:glycerol-3-phosphate O-acyltransferase